MLIDFKDIQVGDEIIVPSNSNLKYLKVLKLGIKSHLCSIQKGVTKDITTTWAGTSYMLKKKNTCETDISKHNATFYLKDEEGYKDMWLANKPDVVL